MSSVALRRLRVDLFHRREQLREHADLACLEALAGDGLVDARQPVALRAVDRAARLREEDATATVRIDQLTRS